MSNARLEHVPLDRIIVGERFRKDYKDIASLSEAIKEKGVIQPITLNANYELQAGGRRTAAAKMAQLETIPALIRDTTDELDLREVELMENISREDLTWVERSMLTKKIQTLQTELHANAPKERANDKGWSQSKTASLLGKSVGVINKHLQLADALESVPELAKCKTEDEALKLIKRAQKHVTVNRLREDQDKRMSELPMVKHAQTHFRVGDALEGLKDTIETYRDMGTLSNIGLFEVDPPYGIELHDMKRGGMDNEYKEINPAEYSAWLDNLAELLYMAAGRDCWLLFWFGPTWFTEVKAALEGANWEVDDIPGIWSKGTGQTMQPEHHLANTYEPFFIARKGSPRINQPGRANVFSFPPVPASNKWHPTQRPLGLIQEMLRTFAMPGTVCCSPFLGSGTTIMAAYSERMACFGYDLSQKHKDRFLLEVEEIYRQSEVLEA